MDREGVTFGGMSAKWRTLGKEQTPESQALGKLESELWFSVKVPLEQAILSASMVDYVSGSHNKQSIALSGNQPGSIYLNVHKGIDEEAVLRHFEPQSIAIVEEILAGEIIPKVRADITRIQTEAVTVLRNAMKDKFWTDPSREPYNRTRPGTITALADELETLDPFEEYDKLQTTDQPKETVPASSEGTSVKPSYTEESQTLSGDALNSAAEALQKKFGKK